MFYLVTYGLTTLGAFAVVGLVRDSAGEQSAISRWAGLGKHSPVVAGVFALFLLRMAGIPLTSGFTGKWAVFEVALAAGAWPVVIVAVLASAAAAFFYVRVIVVMYFHEPDVRQRARRAPVDAVRGGDRRLGRGDDRAGRPAGAGSRSGPVCGTIHQVSHAPTRLGDAGLAMPVTDDVLAGRLAERMQAVERALRGPRPQPRAVRDQRRQPPDGGRRQALPAAARAARRRGRVAPGLRRRDHRGLRGRADPPRLAVPRRRDGRGRAASWCRVGQRPLGQPRRDPHRRLPVLEVLGADRRARGRRRPHPGADVHPAGRGPDPGDREARARATTRSSTTSTSSPARPGR